MYLAYSTPGLDTRLNQQAQLHAVPRSVPHASTPWALRIAAD